MQCDLKQFFQASFCTQIQISQSISHKSCYSTYKTALISEQLIYSIIHRISHLPRVRTVLGFSTQFESPIGAGILKHHRYLNTDVGGQVSQGAKEVTHGFTSLHHKLEKWKKNYFLIPVKKQGLHLKGLCQTTT